MSICKLIYTFQLRYDGGSELYLDLFLHPWNEHSHLDMLPEAWVLDHQARTPMSTGYDVRGSSDVEITPRPG